MVLNEYDGALSCLEAGAIEVVPKPNESYSIGDVAGQLAEMIRGATRVQLKARVSTTPTKVAATTSLAETTHKVVALGASTGGTEALRVVLESLPKQCPGIVMTQHMRGRVQAAIDALQNEGKLTENLAAIGYCFGGTVLPEAPRHGFDLDAVVSFHGGLKFESAPRRGQVSASVLVCNGYDDPYVPIEDRQDFKREMQQAEADFVFIDYANAVHSFTSKAAGPPAEGKGAAYDETADERSWRTMQDWFEQTMPN